MNQKIKFIFFFIAFLAVASIMQSVSLANGGDQRIVDNKYFINLSRAPFTPRVGVQTSFLASFVDIEKNKLIGEDMLLKIRISKLGDAPKGNFIFTQDNIKVNGGVSDFKYTFADSGLHEIFFDFALAANPTHVYKAPDFLIDVQLNPELKKQDKHIFIVASLGVIFAFLIGFVIGRRVKLIKEFSVK